MLNLNKTLKGVILLTAVWQFNAQAEGVKMYTDRPPSAEEMAKILFANPDSPAATKPTGFKTRSINFSKTKIPEPSLAEAKQASESGNRVGLPIEFGYNSTEILTKSLPFLDQVGKMMSMPDLADKRIVVEGHTDASGSQQYNQYLSERRAEAVKTYLMNKFNVAESRLFVNGMGENQPLEGYDPYAAVNRRVQFYQAP